MGCHFFFERQLTHAHVPTRSRRGIRDLSGHPTNPRQPWTTRKSTHGQGIAACSPHESNPGRQGYHLPSLPRMLPTTRLLMLWLVAGLPLVRKGNGEEVKKRVIINFKNALMISFFLFLIIFFNIINNWRSLSNVRKS